MKKIIILGSGAGGTMVATKLRKELSDAEWQITIIDNDEMHHYQPGWLFIPFGIYTAKDCMKPKREFIPKGVDFVLDEVVGVNTDQRTVEGKKDKYNYDWLVIAGARAQYKGSGTLIIKDKWGGPWDSEYECKFKLTAIDGQRPGGGGTDKFRIKIWLKYGNEDYPIYDNQMGDGDLGPLTTEIGGGSIQIKKG